MSCADDLLNGYMLDHTVVPLAEVEDYRPIKALNDHSAWLYGKKYAP